MNIERSEKGEVTIFALTGRLDANSAASVDRAFAAEIANGTRRVVWDFSGLTYISSAGLRSVLQALKQVAANGGKLATCSLSRNVLEVFDISGFKSLLTICADRASAVDAVA